MYDGLDCSSWLGPIGVLEAFYVAVVYVSVVPALRHPMGR
jgi:hypothetical protein